MPNYDDGVEKEPTPQVSEPIAAPDALTGGGTVLQRPGENIEPAKLPIDVLNVPEDKPEEDTSVKEDEKTIFSNNPWDKKEDDENTPKTSENNQ